MYSAGRKTSRYTQICATDYDLRRNRLLSINVSRYTEIVLKNVSASRKTPRYPQIRATDYNLRRNRLLGINVSPYTEIVLKNVLSGSKNLHVHSNSRESCLLGISVSLSTSPQKRVEWVILLHSHTYNN